MNNVVFYRKLISLLELKLNEELKKEFLEKLEIVIETLGISN